MLTPTNNLRAFPWMIQDIQARTVWGNGYEVSEHGKAKDKSLVSVMSGRCPDPSHDA